MSLGHLRKRLWLSSMYPISWSIYGELGGNKWGLYALGSWSKRASRWWVTVLMKSNLITAESQYKHKAWLLTQRPCWLFPHILPRCRIALVLPSWQSSMLEAHTMFLQNRANKNIVFIPCRLDVYFASTLHVLIHELRQVLWHRWLSMPNLRNLREEILWEYHKCFIFWHSGSWGYRDGKPHMWSMGNWEYLAGAAL